MTSELNARQEHFCQEYVVDGNASRAALAAGYSPRTAPSQASRLLKNVKVAARIAELRREMLERVRLDADSVLRELLSLATADPLEILTDAGQLRPLSEIPPPVRRAIAGITHGPNGASVRLVSKLDALEKLAKHLGLYAEDNQQKADGMQRLVEAIKGSERNNSVLDRARQRSLGEETRH